MFCNTLRAGSVVVLTALLAGCAGFGPGSGLEPRTATIQRTKFGVAHITAPDFESLAYGVAYAHAQDNVCLTAQSLVTARGERAATFGAAGTGQLGLRWLPNEQVDFFVAQHMDDEALSRAWATTSPEVQAMARGYVAGYNRFLSDHADRLPQDCRGQPWIQPMTLAEYYRAAEISAVQAGVAALADGMLAAQPPRSAAAAAAQPAVDLAGAAEAMRQVGLLDSPFGSNAWAFGRDTTEGRRGMLLGNPHFPWVGTNRFWQMHVKVPGKMDAMGASLGLTPLVQIGFTQDVAWSHTVSTGKRFTLHELALAPNDPTTYLVDGKPHKMNARTLSIRSRGADGSLSTRQHTVWETQWGPVVVLPRAGLNWTAERAYALKDANAGNVRSQDAWLGFARARNVNEIRSALRGLGMPWVNTIATDREGNAMYADVSVVPDVDAAQLARCAPSQPAAALLGAAGLVVLNGARSDCDWRRDQDSPVPGLTPIERMAVAVRGDWVQNSNDSFFYTHPGQAWPALSPLVGDDVMRRPRTREGLFEIRELVSKGPVTQERIQRALFYNRNLMGRVTVPDLLAACPQAPTPEAKEGCAVLKRWNWTSDLHAVGAVLFREFWRTASKVPGVYREPFDKARAEVTPSGLNMANAEVAGKVWEALGGAVRKIRAAGFKPDATLVQVQRPGYTDEPVPLHGGDEIEGVLNNLGDRAEPGISRRGIRIDYGTSYLQTVGFDEHGPVAQAILTYGQSSSPGSQHRTDQLWMFTSKRWPKLPFHLVDVVGQQIGEAVVLTRP